MTDTTHTPDLSKYSPEVGHLVFELAASWDKLATVAVVTRDGCLLVAAPDGSTKQLTAADTIVPMVFARSTRAPEIAGAVRRAWEVISRELFGGAKQPEVLADVVERATGLERAFVEYAIRCCVAAGFVDPLPGTKPRLALSPMIRQALDEEEYAFTIGAELDHSFRRLNHLIDHGPTIGSHHESLLRSLLRRFLPERYHVATGFVVGRFPGPRSQIDIIVYDRLNYVPRYREDDLVVVDVDAVRALIEVKTSLDKRQLFDALELLHNTTFREVQRMPYFKGIFSFDGISNPETISQHIVDFYELATQKERGHMNFWGPIDAVAVRRQCCVFLDPAPKENQTYLQAIPTDPDRNRDEATSQFLWSVFSFLDVPRESKRAALQLFLGGTHRAKFLGKLNRHPWEPTMFAPRMPTGGKALEDFVFHVSRWRLGWEDWQPPT